MGREIESRQGIHRAGLPDGIFSKRKSRFELILEGLAREEIFLYGHLVYFTAIWYSLLPLGIFNGNLVYFPHFGMLHKVKSGNPSID
jgi:hypothetical protein